MGGKTLTRHHPAPAVSPVCTLSRSQLPAHTLPMQNYVRTSSGKLVCGAHSCCINIYKTFQWTLQMSKCLLFRLLCQYLLSISFMGIQQGSCLSGSYVTGDVNPACTSEQVEVLWAGLSSHGFWKTHSRDAKPGEHLHSWNWVIFFFHSFVFSDFGFSLLELAWHCKPSWVDLVNNEAWPALWWVTMLSQKRGEK